MASLHPLYSQQQQQTGKASPYLPSYLFGERTPQQPTLPPSMPLSGQHGITSPESKSSTRGMPYPSPAERRIQRLSPLSSLSGLAKEKPGAPPIESLYSNTTPRLDELKKEQKFYSPAPANKVTMFGANNTPGELTKTPGLSSAGSTSDISVFSPRPESNFPQSPAQIDPFYTEGGSISSEDILDDTAVTIFGFPPAAASYILQQFSQYGPIIKHEIHNNGNWMHLKYQTRIQAKKALSKNCKIFARNIMVGVTPCIKKEIAAMETDQTTICATPGKARESLSSVPIVGTPSTPRPSSMRSLGTTPYKTPAAGSEVLTVNQGTPKKKDGVLTKTLDYVFGW